MIITKIEPQKHHKDRCSVFLDDDFAFGISNFELHRLHLKVGESLSAEQLEDIRQEVLVQDTRQYALRLLDRRAYTEKALRRKLSERGCDPQAIEDTVSFLKEYQYIDDAVYARRYIAAALHTGKSGMKKIKYDLTGKGIPRDIVEEVAAEFADDELAADERSAVLPLLEKKLKGDFSFPSKMKAKRYCLSRGFSTEAIDSALRQLQEEEEEWFDA